LNTTLSNTVLVVCTHSRKINCLSICFNAQLEIFCVEGSVVGPIGLDTNTVGRSHVLKCLLGSDSFTRIQRYLVPDPNKARCMIHKQSPTVVPIFVRFTASRVGKATFQAATVLINRHTITGSQMFLLEGRRGGG